MCNSLKSVIVLLVFVLGTFCLPIVAEAELDTRMLEENLAKSATYDYGRSRESLSKLTDIIRLAYGNPQDTKQIEKAFLKFLRSDATFASKQFICQQLSIIATGEAVPTLTAMLTDTKTSDMARYALERIPGDAVDRALREALPKTAGKTKVGIINTLGVRGSRTSVHALTGLIYDPDLMIASAAVNALGQIADYQATSALGRARNKTTGKLRLLVLDAYLKGADSFLANGDARAANIIYKQLYSAAGEPDIIRVAALRGIVAVRKDKATGIVIDEIRGTNQAMRTAAIGLIGEIPGTRIVRAVIAELSDLPAPEQVQLLTELANRGDKIALPAVISATNAKDVSIRMAALKALGRLGDDSNVDRLAKVAATTTGAEQQAAREALYRLRGPKVDQTILSHISFPDSKVKVELVRSIGRRNIYTAVTTLLKTAKDTDSKVRLESVKALKAIAHRKDLPVLVNLLLNIQSDAERSEAEKTVVAVAHKISDKNRQAEAVLTALPSVKDVSARCSLLAVLGKIADDSALPALRSALKDKNVKVNNAAIRALSDWPTPKPASDLLQIAQHSGNEKQRVLALRGFVRLIGLDSTRSAAATIGMYHKAMELASNANEKKMVLSGLASVKSFESLQFTADYLADEALQQEAEAAVIKIAEATLGKGHPQKTRQILQKIIQTTKNDSLRKKAQEILKKIK